MLIDLTERELKQLLKLMDKDKDKHGHKQVYKDLYNKLYFDEIKTYSVDMDGKLKAS